MDWLLNVLPNWFTWVFITFGVVLFIIESFFKSILPQKYVIAIGALSIALFASGFYLQGRQDVVKSETKTIEKVVEKIVYQDRIVTQTIVKELKDKQQQTGIIYEKIEKTITTKDDSMCVLPESFVRLHNASANALPETTAGTDGAAAGVTLSDAERTIADNYKTYHLVSDQLTELQKWVDNIQKINK